MHPMYIVHRERHECDGHMLTFSARTRDSCTHTHARKTVCSSNAKKMPKDNHCLTCSRIKGQNPY